MGGITPVYGIHYPNATTKAKDLGTELGTMGTDIERALQAAEVPAVTNSQFIVAASAAARNAYFGQPGTVAAQRALQATGASCYRSDRGWTEQYFAGSAADHPQGVSAPNWYPVHGKMPALSAARTGAAQDIASATFAPVQFNSEPIKYSPDGQFTWNAAGAYYTVNQAGIYNVTAMVQISAWTLRILTQIIATGNKTISASMYGNNVNAAPVLSSGVLNLAAGATVQVTGRTEQASTISDALLSLTYVGPF
jgi:hypothetical protein